MSDLSVMSPMWTVSVCRTASDSACIFATKLVGIALALGGLGPPLRPRHGTGSNCTSCRKATATLHSHHREWLNHLACSSTINSVAAKDTTWGLHWVVWTVHCNQYFKSIDHCPLTHSLTHSLTLCLCLTLKTQVSKRLRGSQSQPLSLKSQGRSHSLNTQERKR